MPSAPKLFMRRGLLLVSRGSYAQAIPELETALRFAEVDSDIRVRQKVVVHLLRGLAAVNGHLGRPRVAVEWLRKAREVQYSSGQVWVPTLDEELELLEGLAGKGP